MLKIKYALIGIALILITNKVLSQSDSIAFAAADTSRFSPNYGGGWQLFNSYVHSYQTDSARFELIIQHANNIKWNNEQYIGTISDSSLIPSQKQSISFNLLTNNYMLRIDTRGRCYIRFVNGDLPTDDPFVIPFKISYKL